MIRNYFKIALRNIWKGSTLSAINIFGLSIGISAALVIWMIVYYDLSFEKDRPNKDRIYRIVSDMSFGNTIINSSAVPFPMPAAVSNEVTGIEKTAHTYTFRMDVRTAKDNEPLRGQDDLCFTDPGFFEVYPYEWLYGNPRVLAQPYQVVLTADRAETYFPGVPPAQVVGRTLIYSDTLHMTVSGIVKPYEGRSSLNKLSDFISLATIPNEKSLVRQTASNDWESFNSSCNVHLLLRPGVTPQKIDAQLKLLAKKYKGADNKTVFHLQPFSDSHFSTQYEIFDVRRAHLPTLYGLTALAIFLLLLGCINFINIQTARAGERAREIGIRKTMGSSRSALVRQFLGESLLLASFAAIFSLLLVPVILKVFDSFLPADLSIRMLKEWQVFVGIPLLVIVVSLLSGFYPAWVLARFQPVMVLKNQVHGTHGKARLRKVLTVSQFLIALVFISATLIVNIQTRYAFNKELGFRKDMRLIFKKPSQKKPLDAFRDQLQGIPEVEQSAYGSSSPSAQGTSAKTFFIGDHELKEKGLLEVKFVDTAYIPVYKLKLLAGRNLFASDTSREYVVNETFVKKAGFATPEAAIGQLLHSDEKSFPIVGVVQDFHTKSMREDIKPVLLTTDKNVGQQLHVALRDGVNVKLAVAKIEKAWKEVYPDYPFKADFLDQLLKQFYEDETNLIKLLSWATGVTIFISLLGLLGLAIYTTRQRTKEIGIRKVMGASVASIIALFSRDVVKLLVIALALATPLAWYVMNRWLNDFAYHIPMPWWVFPVAGSGAITLALLTVGLQSLKAATMNPVQSLKTE